MNLYLVSQDEQDGYDTYDSMIVAAWTPEQAIRLDPGDFREWREPEGCWYFVCDNDNSYPETRSDWANNLENIKCKLIGVTSGDFDEPKVILASFNAG